MDFTKYHACHAKSCGVMTSTSWFQPYRRILTPMAKIGRGFQLLVYRVISEKFSAWLVKRLLLIPSCFQRLRKKKNTLNSEEIWKRKKESIVWLRRREDEKIWELKIWKCWEKPVKIPDRADVWVRRSEKVNVFKLLILVSEEIQFFLSNIWN